MHHSAVAVNARRLQWSVEACPRGGWPRDRDTRLTWGWVSGQGDFGEFTFIQELPDIDWDSGERGVTLDSNQSRAPVS